MVFISNIILMLFISVSKNGKYPKNKIILIMDISIEFKIFKNNNNYRFY